MSYASLKDAVGNIAGMVTPFLAKTHIAEALGLLSVHPGCNLLGFKVYTISKMAYQWAAQRPVSESNAS